MPECRICKQQIDKSKNDWIMPSTNYYYHKECYEKWKHSNPEKDEAWKSLIYDFLSRDLKVSYNYFMCESQFKKFVETNKYTYRGILFALKYFYEVKHGDWDKGHGGIGIIPYIYNESCAYWADQEHKQKGIIDKIERQMRERQQRATKTIRHKVEPRTLNIDFDAVEEMGDDW